MAWATRSIGQGLIATVTFVIWGSSEVFAFDAPADWSSLLLALGIGPLAWQRRSAVLTAVLLAGLYWLLMVNSSHWGGAPGAFAAAFSLSALLIAAAKLVRLDAATPPSLPAVMRFFGLCGFLVCAYILGFAEAAEDLLRSASRHREAALPDLCYRWGLFAFAAAAWAWAASLARRGRGLSIELEEWLFPSALVFSQVTTLLDMLEFPFLVAIVFNLVVLFVGAMWVARGCREGRLRPTVIGSVLIALLVFARYFDLFDSLAARGLTFVLLGAAMFAEGFYYRRLRRAGAAQPGTATA
jgi:hypothetical protein